MKWAFFERFREGDTDGTICRPPSPFDPASLPAKLAKQAGMAVGMGGGAAKKKGIKLHAR